MDWKTMLAFMTGSVDAELLRRNESLAAENRILRAHIPGRVTPSGATKRPRLVWLLAGRPLMARVASPPSPVSGGRRADPLSHRQMRILSVGLVGWPRTDVWSAASGGAET